MGQSLSTTFNQFMDACESFSQKLFSALKSLGKTVEYPLINIIFRMISSRVVTSVDAERIL